MISLASDYKESQHQNDNGEGERQETDQEDRSEHQQKYIVDDNIKINFDNFVANKLSEDGDDHQRISRANKKLNYSRDFEQIPNNDQSRRTSQNDKNMKLNDRNLAGLQFDDKLQELANQRDKDLIFEEHQDVLLNENLTTDQEGIMLQNQILELIFVDDLVTLSQLLQLTGNGGAIKASLPEYDDVFEFKVNELESKPGMLHHYQDDNANKNYRMNEAIRNLNWYGEHIKTNLDSQITPLTQAAYLGRKNVVDMMLENFTYLDLNMATKENGYTPISGACMAGNFEIVSLLAENGADVNKVDIMQQSPLIYCFSRLNEDENYFENKALALKMADVLLSYGADINQYSLGRTILMNFCRQKYTNMIKIQQKLLLDVIKYLLLHGADAFNLKCQKQGKSAYEFALQNQQDAMKKNKDKESIENQIIDILINTKQQYMHPKIAQRNAGSSMSANGNSKRQHRSSTMKQYTTHNGIFQVESQPREVIGCCGCSTTLFNSLCKQ